MILVQKYVYPTVEVEIDLVEQLADLSNRDLVRLRKEIDARLEVPFVSEDIRQQRLEAMLAAIRTGDERKVFELARTIVCDELGVVC